MKPAENHVDCSGFDKDEAELAVMVRRGFAALGGPSDNTMSAISAAARRAAWRSAARLSWVRPRFLAAAAAAVIAAGALYLNLNRTAPGVGSQSSPGAGFGAESTQDLAALLLDIQGLNEESFFMTEETEPLWL